MKHNWNRWCCGDFLHLIFGHLLNSIFWLSFPLTVLHISLILSVLYNFYCIIYIYFNDHLLWIYIHAYIFMITYSLIFKFIYIIICIYDLFLSISMCLCEWMSLGACVCQDQRRMSDSLELEFQAIVSNWIWLLGIKHGHSGKRTGTLNYWAISLVLRYLNYTFAL